MTYKGHIEGGTVVFDENAPLPDGTRVRVEVVENISGIHPDIARLSGILPRTIDARSKYSEGMLRKHQ